jgi:hypothetical protein
VAGASFVVSCAIFVHSAKSLLLRHDERGVIKEQKVPFSVAAKTAVFVSPFEKNLLT